MNARIVKRGETSAVEMLHGIKRATLVFGERLMLTVFTYEKGAVMKLHKHPHEQASYIVNGRYRVKIGETERVMEEGDCYFVPANVEHSQVALERTISIDAFSPPREEYKDKQAQSVSSKNFLS